MIKVDRVRLLECFSKRLADAEIEEDEKVKLLNIEKNDEHVLQRYGALSGCTKEQRQELNESIFKITVPASAWAKLKDKEKDKE